MSRQMDYSYVVAEAKHTAHETKKKSFSNFRQSIIPKDIKQNWVFISTRSNYYVSWSIEFAHIQTACIGNKNAPYELKLATAYVLVVDQQVHNRWSCFWLAIFAIVVICLRRGWDIIVDVVQAKVNIWLTECPYFLMYTKSGSCRTPPFDHT